jgi:esterase/lipase superfamily enzyme
MKENSVENRIVEVANNGIDSKLNLVQYKEERERVMRHKAVCEAVIAFKANHKFMPMYAILSVGVSAGAFKNAEFEKGYKSFDEVKARAVYEMACIYNEAINKGNEAPNDVVYRVCSKYYKKHNGSADIIADFSKSVAKMGKKKAKVLSDERENYEAICVAVGC